jgi:hypothetical protein
MMDGKRINPNPTAQSRARQRLNERRTEIGMLPVLADAEVRALLRDENLCEEESAPRSRRTVTRHYVKS